MPQHLPCSVVPLCGCTALSLRHRCALALSLALSMRRRCRCAGTVVALVLLLSCCTSTVVSLALLLIWRSCGTALLLHQHYHFTCTFFVPARSLRPHYRFAGVVITPAPVLLFLALAILHSTFIAQCTHRTLFTQCEHLFCILSIACPSLAHRTCTMCTACCGGARIGHWWLPHFAVPVQCSGTNAN